MMTTMNYSMLDNGTMFSFCKHALSLFGNEENIAPTLLPFYNKAKKYHNMMLNIFEKESIDPYTQKKATADKNRNRSFYAFKHIVSACAICSKESIQTAGKKLMSLINKHTKSLSRLGYKKQSSAEILLIDEIRKEHMAELEECNAIVWFEEMEKDQVRFESVMKESLEDLPDGLPKMTDTRYELTKELRSLFSLVDLLSQATPDDELIRVRERINQLILDTMSKARAVDTRKKNKLKKDVENDIYNEYDVG